MSGEWLVVVLVSMLSGAVASWLLRRAWRPRVINAKAVIKEAFDWYLPDEMNGKLLSIVAMHGILSSGNAIDAALTAAISVKMAEELRKAWGKEPGWHRSQWVAESDVTNSELSPGDVDYLKKRGLWS